MSCQAHFTVSWCREDVDQFGSVLSRTAYIIKISNSPIIWLSKIQIDIVLLTTEPEYISLSQSMRNLITLKQVISYLLSVFGTKCDSCNSYTKTVEDNKGAIELSKEPIYRPQTKHISI